MTHEWWHEEETDTSSWVGIPLYQPGTGIYLGKLTQTSTGTLVMYPPPGLTAQQAVQWSAQIAGTYITEGSKEITLNSQGIVVDKRTLTEAERGSLGLGGTSAGDNNAFTSSENQKDRDFKAAQAEEDRRIAREELASRERSDRLAARDRFMQYLNSIQADDARLNSGLNSLVLQGTTPTIGYGNALTEGINTLNTQIAAPPPPGTPIPSAPIAPLSAQPPGMAMGGSFGPMGDVTFGSTKEAILVGEERSGIDGSAEVAIRDKRTGALQEIIPLAGGAAEGATVYSDPTSVYGTLSPLYQPFGITDAGGVPTRANATPTSLGYIAPRFNTDFAPIQPPAYGPLSEQFFSRTTGMLLPNPSTILRELRNLYQQSPTAYNQAMLEYEASTNAAGQKSGLNRLAIEAMMQNAALSPKRTMQAIGIR